MSKSIMRIQMYIATKTECLSRFVVSLRERSTRRLRLRIDCRGVVFWAPSAGQKVERRRTTQVLCDAISCD